MNRSQAPRRRLAVLGLALVASCQASPPPLALHPDNPRCFLYDGRPTLLITSGEHYGAVLNRDFDFRKYLATLAADGLNLTRTFSGCYIEDPGAFRIARNTLAPTDDAYLAPWPRTADGRYDLARWNPDYFERLHAFLDCARHHGVIVELVLFCPMYGQPMWDRSPMNGANNVNRVGRCKPADVYFAGRSDGLLPFQLALVRKLVGETNRHPNLYYEVANEPYIDGKVPREFEDAVIAAIGETERALPNRHLVSLNIANGSAVVGDPNPAVSIFNFHYARPPVAVAMNRHLGKVVGENETGFKGQANAYYRGEAWEFILAGGALFNHLDYSFAVGHEDGSFDYPDHQPGGGNAAFRREMAALARFMRGLDFIRMDPAPEVVRSGVPGGQRVQCLAEPGRQYALYLTGGGRATLVLDLPAGRYTAEWLNPADGAALGSEELDHRGGDRSLRAPEFPADIALQIVRAG